MLDKLKIFAALFVLVLLVGSCKNLNRTATEAALDDSPVDTLIVVVEKPVEPRDSLVLAFEKGACFGRCPVYKIKVYDSGLAIYEGINFTKLLGKYSAQFSEKELLEIYQEARAIEYFELDSKYDDPLISDLPTTKSVIQLEGMSNAVTARANVPQKLKDFHENLGIRLLERAWVSHTGN